MQFAGLSIDVHSAARQVREAQKTVVSFVFVLLDIVHYTVNQFAVFLREEKSDRI